MCVCRLLSECQHDGFAGEMAFPLTPRAWPARNESDTPSDSRPSHPLSPSATPLPEFHVPEEELTELKRHAMPINFRNEGGASLHPGGKRFIAGGSDLWVRVFDYDTGAELECLKVRMDRGYRRLTRAGEQPLCFLSLYAPRVDLLRIRAMNAL